MSALDTSPSVKLADYRAAVSAQDWDRILEWGRDDAFLGQNHHALKAYITAAYERSEAGAIRQAAEIALRPEWPHPLRYSIARAFLAAERHDLAWDTIQAGPGIMADPAFLKQARQTMAHTKDKGLRMRIRRTVAEAMKGGHAVVAAASDLSFPAPESQPGAFGTAVAALGSRTAPRHLAAFHHKMEQTRIALAAAKQPSLREINNVFVDRHGQIWREDGAIIKTSGIPIPPVRRGEVPNVDVAFFGIKATRGIYHWLVDRVSSYAWMRDDDPRGPLILLSDQAPAFETETLDLLGLSERVSRVGEATFVERLIVPRVGFAGLMYWDRVAPVFNRLTRLSRTIARSHALVGYERIYISRSDAKRRPLSNEKEIEAALARDGYEIVSFTGMPLWRQFFLASSAREIVAPHGAGLSHIILCTPGTKVTEILPIKDGTYSLRFNYGRLSLARGHEYRAWLEPQIGDEDSWTVDAEAFLDHLRTPQGEVERTAAA